MIYNTSDKNEVIRMKNRIDRLVDKGVNIEVIEKTKKSLQHNNYFHLLCSYFGMETGYTTEEAKMIVKTIVCKDVFEYENKGMKFIKSFADITKEETSYVIEKFKNFSANQAGIVLPEADNYEFLQYIQSQSSKFNNKIYNQ
jgi:hypothetical protein